MSALLIGITNGLVALLCAWGAYGSDDERFRTLCLILMVLNLITMVLQFHFYLEATE